MSCFVTPHALQRFKLFIADIDDEQIISWFKLQIQDHSKIIGIQMYDRKPQPIYCLEYNGKAFYIPLRKQHGQLWPIIPTILRKYPENIHHWRGGRWEWR
jgi:hypothetical protein